MANRNYNQCGRNRRYWVIGLYRGYVGYVYTYMELFRGYMGGVMLDDMGVIQGLYWDNGKENGNYYMAGCQNYGPFLGPYYNTAPNI